MAVFEEVRILWRGEEYLVPVNGMLKCIAMIEDVLTLGELAIAQGRGRLPLSKLASAFGIALRCAGAQVTDEEVYNEFFKDKGASMRRQAQIVIASLQTLMIPPEHLRAKPSDKPGKKDVAASPAASKRSASSTSS